MPTDLTTYRSNRTVPSLLGGHVFDDFFSNIFSDFPTHLTHSTRGYPVTDIYRDEDGSTTLELALAGFSKDDLSVNIQPEKRTIIVSANTPAAEEDSSQRRIARRSFKKTYVNYDDNLDIAKAEANFENGLLIVRVPARPDLQPVEIEIL
tara:strand:+ start:793 stop:1242 length:450 start_codon:yes stop_codon:yes gene_type:complete